jgi:Alpha-L-arabinofuranosidase B (ABFB) domain
MGELTSVQSSLDREDATFLIYDGNFKWGSTVTLGAVNSGWRFLRHQNFRIRLDQGPGLHPPGVPLGPEEELFLKDSTFILEHGLADPADQTLVSFRSVNFPDRFIRHRDFHLFLEPADTELAKQDATFRLHSPFAAPPEVPIH